MFTGIVEEVGQIERARDADGNLRLTISAARVLEGAGLGDSIAVSGCCLTVVALGEGSFEVELSLESVAKTAPRWHVGARVNLERALTLSDRLGGHLVSGHVDGVGEVLRTRRDPGAYVLEVAAPAHLKAHLIPKGSITVDGVSLTLVDVGGAGGTEPAWPAERFSLWLIPHTLEVTTLGELTAGSRVNVESDLLAKYVERQQLLGQQQLTSLEEQP